MSFPLKEKSMTVLTKIDVARRQLGTALSLFIEDLDPVSVHTLGGAGAELAEHLARDVGSSPFVEHVFKTNPAMPNSEYYRLARQYYNAFKHVTDHSGGKRDDEDLLASFDDKHNDALLFIAWSDLATAMGSSPIEVQVFQVWFYASHPTKLAKREDAARMTSAFPGLSELARAERKLALKSRIASARTDDTIMADHRTDRRPLVWSEAPR